MLPLDATRAALDEAQDSIFDENYSDVDATSLDFELCFTEHEDASAWSGVSAIAPDHDDGFEQIEDEWIDAEISCEHISLYSENTAAFSFSAASSLASADNMPSVREKTICREMQTAYAFNNLLHDIIYAGIKYILL